MTSGDLRQSRRPRWWLALGGLVALLLMAGLYTSGFFARFSRGGLAPDAGGDQATQGVVMGPSGPIANAVVRYRATSIETTTDREGGFRLPRPRTANVSVITAAHPDYLIGSAPVEEFAEIRLQPLPEQDNASYVWQDPRPSPHDAKACANCHDSIFAQWRDSGHATAATNQRFRDLHEGRLANGERGGWSLHDDHPDGSGVCFACHAPTARDSTIFAGDFSRLDEVPEQGVHCDFCHKIQDVSVEELGLTHGRDAFSLKRPGGDKQLFFGPLDDVDRGEDAFSPLMRQSQYCAACHEGTVFGMPVYTTYSEWLESKASQSGKSCQSCHMPSDGVTTVFAKGGHRRDPSTLSTHNMLPGGKRNMLRSAIRMSATLTDSLEVRLTTQNVGHATPTGYIDRHLILVVTTVEGQPLTAHTPAGPQLDQLAGPDLAGHWGRLFARIVRDPEGAAPTPFWKSFDDPLDTRLPPDSTTAVRWRFAAPPDKVKIRLLYRRFWDAVRREKGWEDETLVVFEEVVTRAD